MAIYFSSVVGTLDRRMDDDDDDECDQLSSLSPSNIFLSFCSFLSIIESVVIISSSIPFPSFSDIVEEKEL
jgi:hypothetical protein